MESNVGQTVSHYVLVEKLGSGGMGEIYKARDSRLNRIVAVKVLTPGKTRDPERRRRFIQEAQAASALNHPNIITIHDILPEGDTQYMVMEYVAGKTLHDLISAGRLPVPQVLQLATQMANALGVAHQAGIVHRDFKPANVMVTGSGLVKVLDFGLAKLTDLSSRMDGLSNGDENTLTAAPLTREGAIMGTVNYMSPEQAEGLKVDRRSDIFSFGAVLYEMVTGHRAFDGDSGISTLSAVLRDEVKPIREIAPDVPAELTDIVNRCLRKNPEARWQSMTEVETELSSLKRRSDSRIFSSPPVSSISPAVSTPAAVSRQSTALNNAAPKNVVVKAALLGVVCLAVLGLAIWISRWPAQQKQAVVTAPAAAPSTPVADPPSLPNPDQAPATPADTPVPSAIEPAPSNDVPPAPSPEVAPPAPVKATKAKTPPPKTVTTTPGPAPVSPPAATPAPQPPPARVAAAAPVVRSAAPLEARPVKLNDGLPFRIELLADVPIDTEVGRELRFRVLDGVQSGDVTVIAKGSIVTGSVMALAGKRNFFGERSKVRFRLFSAQSVDDAKIIVRATPGPRTDGMETRPFATPNGTKDKNLIAASGTEYIAYISGDQTISVHK